MSDELEVVRLALIRQAAWRAPAVLALTPVLAEVRADPNNPREPPTLAVDAYWRLYWCPQALARWSTQEAAAVLWHECEHLLRRHHARAEALDAYPELWNLAVDAEINDDLPGLPADGVTPKKLRLPEGLLAEEYYKLLLANKSPRVKVIHGSGAGLEAGPWELGAPSVQAPGLSEAAGRLVEARVAQAIQGHPATGRGEVPGFWKQWAQAVVTPEPPERWDRLLRSFVAGTFAAGREDYTYARPRKRGLTHGLILPGLVRHQPRIALCVDTSGSMSGEGSAVLSTAEAICRVLGAVTLVAGDAAVAAVGQVRGAADVRAKALGGGGTDMRVLLAQALRLRPDVVVVITDGDTPWPEVRPRVPVVVVLTTQPLSPPPSWARVVTI
jgi:predicted metal-dependent peptidase